MGNKQNTLNTVIKHKNTKHHPALQPATAEKQARQAGHKNSMINTQGNREKERMRKNEQFQNMFAHTAQTCTCLQLCSSKIAAAMQNIL